MKRAVFFLLYPLVTLAFAMAVAAAPSGPAGNGAARCERLGQEDFSRIFQAPTHINSAQFVPSSSALPAHCALKGYIAPQVGIEIKLPTDSWNGRFLMQGCGGFCGAVFMQMCEDALARNYAVASTDMGHRSTATDGKWAYNNRQAEIDFAFRATHVTTAAAKEVIKRFYGRAADYAYYRGCSTGGRQGLVEAQMYPDDFDGIIAGAPPMNEVKSAVYALGYPLRVNHDKDGAPILTSDKLPALHAAAINACDMTDGLEDGIIGNPVACQFDPQDIQCKGGDAESCLTKEQVRVARLIYAGAKGNDGRPLMKDGPPPGSEMRWAGYLGEATTAGGNLKRMHEDFMRYMAFAQDPGPDWDPESFVFGRDSAQLQFMERLYNAEHPDLRPLLASGGKLLIYMGLQDSFSAKRLAEYYETVARIINDDDATQNFLKVYMLPGVNHCRGGNGTDAVDWLSAMEAWVEKGETPGTLTGYNLKSGKVPFDMQYPPDMNNIDLIRPVYPYPYRAMYKGTGGPNDLSSYEPVLFEMPER